MKRNLILLFGFLVLISCKEQVAKFIFDASKMSNQTKYFYQYDSDRLITQIEKNYTIMFGQVADSMISQTDFAYNDKGLLIQEETKTDFEEKPTIEIYDYDTNDYLISKITLSPESDTTFCEVYKYFPDGKKTVFHRFLSIRFDPNQDFMEALESKRLDTSFYRNEFDYIDNLCKTQRQYDIKGNLTKTVNFDYKENRMLKETHLIYFNNMEMTDKVKFYNYSKSDTKPDYYAIDSKNDTLEFCINIFNSDKLVKTANMYDYGSIYTEEYYENGLLIGTIDYDRQFNMNKIIYLYEYDEKGILKTEKSYREKINAH